MHVSPFNTLFGYHFADFMTGCLVFGYKFQYLVFFQYLIFQDGWSILIK
jgi:hypothetical protein